MRGTERSTGERGESCALYLEGAELTSALAWLGTPTPAVAEDGEPEPPTPVRVHLRGACRVERTLALPAHLSLELAPGATLRVAAGRTLHVHGGFAASEGEVVFPGPGRVRFGTGAAVRLVPRWWGAAGDGAADDAPALQAMLDALPASGARACVPAGAYRLGRALRVEGRAGWEVAFAPGALLRPAAGCSALEVVGCARWLLREPRVRLGSGARGAVRVRGGSSRGLLHRPRVDAVGPVAPGCVPIVVDEGSRCTEVREPSVALAPFGGSGRFAAGVRLAGGSDGSRVSGGTVRDCAVGVEVDDCDAAAVDGTAFAGVETGIALSASPHRGASEPFRAISARFGEDVARGVEVRSVPGVGTVHPPVLSDLRYAPPTELVRALPGAAVRVIAPVRLEGAAAASPDAARAPRPPLRGGWRRAGVARPFAARPRPAREG